MKLKEGIREKNVVVKCGADTFLPFALVFGLCVILLGTISPGGGFQGGVIVASACLLVYLGYGYDTTSKAIKISVLEVNESLGAILYVLLACCGIVFGVRFCENVFYNCGNIGDLISAGTITFMSFSVGYKVLTGIGFLLLLLLSLLGNTDEEKKMEE
jgi:multicomponent Na+:H+ antiporter subunit B